MCRGLHIELYTVAKKDNTVTKEAYTMAKETYQKSLQKATKRALQSGKDSEKQERS